MYHLTAQNVVGARFAPNALGRAPVTLVGFCPPAAVLQRTASEATAAQHFIHVAPHSVRLLQVGGQRVVSLAHIYGGPVASATVEELAYYGVRTILAYGLAGGLGTSACALGDSCMVADALAADGTTPHYTREPVVAADAALLRQVAQQWQRTRQAPLRPVRAATGDAIYREDATLLASFRARGCDIVNLDSAHLYAACRTNGAGADLRVVQCRAVSDVIPEDTAGAHTDLGAMLQTSPGTARTPMDAVDDIVTFYLETMLPHPTAAGG